MSSAVLGSKARNYDSKRSLAPSRGITIPSWVFFFPPSTLPVLTFLGVAGPRPGSAAPLSYEGSRFPDACDQRTSSQAAARHFQPRPRTQTALSCSGSLSSPWEPLPRKVPSKPGAHSPSSHPGHAPQHACGLSGVFPRA